MKTKTYTLYMTPVNNHGCRGEDVTIEAITDDIGIVISGESCSSCWQVGHDDSSSPIPVGSIVRLPARLPNWADEERKEMASSDPLTWELAAVPCGYSHNELIDDRSPQYRGQDLETGEEYWDDPYPQPDCTLIEPGDLVILGESEIVAEAFQAVSRFAWGKRSGKGSIRAIKEVARKLH